MIQGLLERLRVATAGVELTDEQLATLTREEAELNRWRLQRLTPLMIVMNLAHVALLAPGSPLGLSMSPELRWWADGLFATHLGTALVAMVPLTLLYVLPRPTPSWLGPATALVYQLHAAVIAGVDQLNHGTVAPYVAYALVNVVVVAMTVRQAVVFFGISTVVFVASLFAFQPDPVAIAAVFPTGPSVMIPGISIVWFLQNNRRKDFYFKATIARQRADLERLNGQLAETIDDQVVSLRARADEVERLNTQLREQVRDRSRALAAALGKLAEHEQPTMDALTGRVLAGRYRVGARIGAGGMGIVHEGVDERTDLVVAIKVIRHREHVSPAMVARFLREVETTALLKHPAIVRMLHVDVTEDGVLFQVQELVRGTTLAARLARGPLPQAEACKVLVVLCEALQSAHEAGIVHRDIKPGNVMLVHEAPHVKLLDFGIAKLAASATGALTRTGAVIGTPAFMAPELWEGAEASVSTDVYAVGVTAIQMLTGSLPRMRVGFEVDSLDDALPAALATTLRRCLHDDPAMRPTAAELVDAFQVEEPWDDGWGEVQDEEVQTHLTWSGQS